MLEKKYVSLENFFTLLHPYHFTALQCPSKLMSYLKSAKPGPSPIMRQNKGKCLFESSGVMINAARTCRTLSQTSTQLI